jgi:hypothetical protein
MLKICKVAYRGIPLFVNIVILIALALLGFIPISAYENYWI